MKFPPEETRVIIHDIADKHLGRDVASVVDLMVPEPKKRPTVFVTVPVPDGPDGPVDDYENRAVISGIPGTGKTLMAFRYANWAYKSGDFSTILVLRGETVDMMKEDIAAFGRSIGYKGNRFHVDDIKGKRLIIIDGITTPPNKYLSRGMTSGRSTRFLYTSRKKYTDSVIRTMTFCDAAEIMAYCDSFAPLLQRYLRALSVMADLPVHSSQIELVGEGDEERTSRHVIDMRMRFNVIKHHTRIHPFVTECFRKRMSETPEMRTKAMVDAVRMMQHKPTYDYDEATHMAHLAHLVGLEDVPTLTAPLAPLLGIEVPEGLDDRLVEVYRHCMPDKAAEILEERVFQGEGLSELIELYDTYDWVDSALCRLKVRLDRSTNRKGGRPRIGEWLVSKGFPEKHAGMVAAKETSIVADICMQEDDSESDATKLYRRLHVEMKRVYTYNGRDGYGTIRKAFEVMTEHLGPDHADLAIFHHVLSHTYLKNRQIATAVAELEKAVKIERNAPIKLPGEARIPMMYELLQIYMAMQHVTKSEALLAEMQSLGFVME